MHRRTALSAIGLGGIAWWTRIAERLALADEAAPSGTPARSVIVLWLQGGPSQLETFDPHPGTDIAGGSDAIATKACAIQIDQHYPQLADQMSLVSLVRSVVSKEGDHERATYYLKTGYRPDPTLIHPSLGAILCHQLSDRVEIPRHVSILPNVWAARGGYLGDQFDAFRVNDFGGNIADIKPRVDDERCRRRLETLRSVVEPSFARGRLPDLDTKRTLHQTSIENARRMLNRLRPEDNSGGLRPVCGAHADRGAKTHGPARFSASVGRGLRRAARRDGCVGAPAARREHRDNRVGSH